MNSQDSPHILIVEDSELTAKQICEVVTEFRPDIKCSVVSSEDEAVAAIADTSPDVIVLDLHLKAGTGFGVLKKIATWDKKPRVIVMTNYALPQYRQFALLSGADFFLDKAINMDELSKVLGSFIEPSPPESRTS